MTLVVEHLTKRFGGLVAVNDVSFDLRQGEILGLIGPNGSGKTTVFNLISGVFPPDSGRIRLQDREITAKPPYDIAHAGIARTHQIVQPLSDLSVRDNVAVGACFGHRNLPLGKAYEVADQVLKEVRLAPKGDLPAGKLNVAEKKRLELARALASEPLVVLLDEVLAGLNPSEIATMVGVIRTVHERGIDVVIVEHLMQAIMSLCDRIVVLDSGRVIAQGSPTEIVNDSQVITAYLGDPKLIRELEGET